MTVGNRIRKLRIKHGLTQSELADGIVTPSMISLIETDRAKPSEKLLRALANRLGVSFEDITVEESSEWEPSAVNLIAYSFILSGELEKARELLESAPSDSEMSNRFCMMLLAECDILQANYQKAHTLLEQLEEKWHDDKLNLLHVWSRMARLYAEENNQELSVHYWEKVFQVCLHEPNARLDDILEYSIQMCRFYLEEERYDDLIYVHNEIFQKWQLPSNTEELAQNYLYRAIEAKDEKRFQFAATMAHQALTLLRSLKLINGSVHLGLYKEIAYSTTPLAFTSFPPSADHLILAKLYLNNGNLDLALGHANESLNQAVTPRKKAISLRILSEVQEARGDFMEAAETIKQMIRIWEEQGNSEQITKCYTRLTQVLARFSQS